MPFSNTYDDENNLIICRYEGKLTADEVVSSFTDTRQFFVDRGGMVALIVNASAVISLPPSILTYARNAPFARYKPLIIGLVGANALVRSIASVFSVITGISVRTFDSEDEALAEMLHELQEHNSSRRV